MGQILDQHGRPIPDKETRDLAERLLREYFAKHSDRIQDWVRAHGGPNPPPPLYFDTKNKEWIWYEGD